MKKLLLKTCSGGWSLLASVLLTSSLTTTAVGQTTFTLGTGTASNSNVPLTTNYGYNYTQQIYYASELTAQGSAAGSITKIRFMVNTGTTTNNDSWRVLIGHTAKTQFASTTDWEPIASLTEVYNGNVVFAAGGTWMEITLATPFAWNGTGNIVVAIDENTPSFGSLLSWRHTTTTGVNRGIYYRNDSNNPDPAAPPTATGRTGSYPNMQFVMTPGVACSGTPAASSTVASATTVCAGSTVNLSLNNGYFVSGISYQWQKNEGSGFTDVAGATSATYTTPALSASVEYRANVTCANSAQTTSSALASIVVNPIPVVTASSTVVAVCPGDPANVTASGATTYSWAPATGVTPNTTSASVFLLPAVTTTYIVTGTTNGCSSTDTVKVIPVAAVTASVAQSPTEICEPGSTVTLSVSGLPAEISSAGSWAYRWLSADGVTEAQTWNSSNEFSFIPTEDSVYTFYYQLRSTSCPDDAVDSVRYSIISGFGADVALTPFNCNSNGIITLSDIFGQREVEEIYSNSFNGSSSMTGVTLSGNASLTAGRLVLTPSATSNSGNALITVPGQSFGTNNSMTVSFAMTADTPINTFGTGGADGITYSFGNDANPAANGSNPNGRGTKLRLSFDSAGNSTENNNQSGIYLVYGWTANNAFGPASPQTLAYSANTALWKTLTDVPVELVIDATGKAKVTVNGTVVFQNIQMPAAYMSADASAWTHLFSAGTGGDALRHAVKDFSIETGALQLGISQGAATVLPSQWQTDNVFSGLLPGVYNVWVAKDSVADCGKNIGQFEILNTNPVVDLGNDTTICEGDTLLLDAGNPGSVYNWSGSNNYTQTYEVFNAGTYYVQITDPAGCAGLGSIVVGIDEAPSASGIFSNGNFPTVFFSATNAQNTDTYTWNFGDGTTVTNGPSSISHTYTEDGTFTVTLTLENECGTEVMTKSISINDYTALSENTIEGLEVYPNPATREVSIVVPNGQSSVAVYDMTGSMIVAGESFSGKTSVDVSAWNRGVYFLHITNGGTTTISKLIVQ